MMPSPIDQLNLVLSSQKHILVKGATGLPKTTTFETVKRGAPSSDRFFEIEDVRELKGATQ